MNRDLSGEKHGGNPPGCTSVFEFDGRNAVGSGGPPTDCRSKVALPEEDKESEHDFIVEVKVESEFIDDYSSVVRDEAHLGTMETFQSYIQTSQDALSNKHVKQEPCSSPPRESSKVAQLLEEKQMKLVSCNNCSQLLDLEVFNPHMTQSICQETRTFNSVPYNHSCKSFTETLKNIQESETPHKCSVCDKSFTVLSFLNRHLKIHTDLKPHKCSACPKAFAQSKNFIEHQRMHAGEKPYKCSVCNKAFNFSSELRKHERVHSGEKPFKCSFCCKVFSRLSNLHVHQRIHTKQKPYLCSVCGNTFNSSSNLCRHQKQHD
uniref:C2H2-type domain-containing protein n=1 Tax=Eptatretus burgeri TaxID=7764 RepID=A0A8C4QB59_EPTBU